MTLKEELEILRGEPIEVSDGDPMDIPCIETSDSERLCKNPVVSVHMITYNHEPYIRQAIEGVMTQRTDFEFELVIGEDASQDKTRDICFEYQEKCPDKIRVLWWHENLQKVKHPAGGNARRVTAHCRGEFIAFCEGDDCWIDPYKLQKQVDVMRGHASVGLCFCSAMIHLVEKQKKFEWKDKDVFPVGQINRNYFFKRYARGFPDGDGWRWPFIVTSTTMIRSSVLRKVMASNEVFRWRLRLGDLTLWLGMAAESDVFYMPDCVSQYNMTSTGATGRSNDRLYVDGLVVRMYYLISVQRSNLNDLPASLVRPACRALLDWLAKSPLREQKRLMRSLTFLSLPDQGWICKMISKLILCGFLKPWSAKWFKRLLVRFI